MAATSTEADKYEVLEKIGHGSFGVIRKVKRKIDGKILCRKEINYVKMTAREREQLAAEFNILNSLRHENIVGYYHRDHLRDHQEVHLYMEYCGGGDLAIKIKEFGRKNERPSEEYVWDVVAQLASALYRCHNGEVAPAVRGNILGPPASPRGLRSKTQVMILHRDLKPENIFVGEDDSLKLGDFGLSKAISQHDLASTYVGTPYYMSPEICASERYGWHSDIWALGCIIHELCSGRPPFDAKSHLHLMQKIKGGRYDPLPTMYSQELRDLVGKCLQVNPLHRPTTFHIINLPIVRIMRKGRELLAITKALEAQKAQTAQKLADVSAKNTEMQTLVAQSRADHQTLVEKVRQETLETMRAEVDATLRREWEVKAQLEISKHCKLESDRLQRLFDSELQRHIDIGVATQVNAFKRWHQRQQQLSKGVDTPPSTDVSRLSFDLAVAQVSTSSFKRPSRTPLLKAKSQMIAADSPMDIKMTSPSPACTALALSPRRAAAGAGGPVSGLVPSDLFPNRVAAKERWRPQLAYQSDSEEEEREVDDGIPDLPSPTIYRGQQRVLGIPTGGDPFKIPQSQVPVKPGFRRQQTLPVHITPAQPDIFNNGTTTTTMTSKSLVPATISPSRQANKFLAKAATVVAADNGGIGAATTGRTLVELNQARVANMTNIQNGQTLQAQASHVVNKDVVAVWDPEVETEMPSPFVIRKGRGVVA